MEDESSVFDDSDWLQTQPKPLPIQKYLLKHPHEVSEHISLEKELRHIVLQAAENGYNHLMCQALPVLTELQNRHKYLTATPDFESLLDFYEGKGGLQVPQSGKQVGQERS